MFISIHAHVACFLFSLGSKRKVINIYFAFVFKSTLREEWYNFKMFFSLTSSVFSLVYVLFNYVKKNLYIVNFSAIWPLVNTEVFLFNGNPIR